MDRSSTARPFWRVCIVRTCRQQSYLSASTILLMRSIVRVLLNSLLGPRLLVANCCNASTAAASHPAPPLRKIQSQQQFSAQENISLFASLQQQLQPKSRTRSRQAAAQNTAWAGILASRVCRHLLRQKAKTTYETTSSSTTLV